VIDLLPLPEPEYPSVYLGLGKQQRAGYTADQMQQYAMAHIRAERRRISLLVEAVRDANAAALPPGEFGCPSPLQEQAWRALRKAVKVGGDGALRPNVPMSRTQQHATKHDN
jgi:hypothetical protein